MRWLDLGQRRLTIEYYRQGKQLRKMLSTVSAAFDVSFAHLARFLTGGNGDDGGQKAIEYAA
jgi:hypothetical protein